MNVSFIKVKVILLISLKWLFAAVPSLLSRLLSFSNISIPLLFPTICCSWRFLLMPLLTQSCFWLLSSASSLPFSSLCFECSSVNWDGITWEAGCKQRKARSNCDNFTGNKTELGPCAAKFRCPISLVCKVFFASGSPIVYGCDWRNGPCVCTNRGTFSKTRQKCWPASEGGRLLSVRLEACGMLPTVWTSGSLEPWRKALAVSHEQVLPMHRSCLASDLQGLIFLVFVSNQAWILWPQPGQPLLYMAHVAAEASFVIGERQEDFIPLLPCKRHLIFLGTADYKQSIWTQDFSPSTGFEHEARCIVFLATDRSGRIILCFSLGPVLLSLTVPPSKKRWNVEPRPDNLSSSTLQQRKAFFQQARV